VDAVAIGQTEVRFVTLLETTGLWWWTWLPRSTARLSRGLALTLADGAYLAAWPVVGAFAAPASLMMGFLCGATSGYARPTYTCSLTMMSAILVPGSLSAALGILVVLGYAVGDTMFGQHLAATAYPLLDVRVPLLISYVMLAVLVLFIPLRSNSLRRATIVLGKPASHFRVMISALLLAAIQGALVYAWTQSAAILIRPLFTWNKDVPPVQAIVSVQKHGWILALIAAALGFARILATSAAVNSPRVREITRRLLPLLRMQRDTLQARLPSAVMIPIGGGFATLMLSGLLRSWTQAFSTASVLILLYLFRNAFATHFAGTVRAISRVPILLRVILATIVSYLVALAVIAPGFQRASAIDTFVPLLAAIGLSLLIATFILPAEDAIRIPAKTAPKRS
jgi:hypothetical protein